jgi:hypothetical protein
MTTVSTARPVSVDELRRAYHAVQAGAFRRHHHGAPPPPVAAWTPESPVLTVVGASSGSGASTVALAVATAAGTSRLLECASTTAAGLTAAATAELGRDGAGWVLGSRGPVRIERVADTLHGPDQVPTPTTPTPGQRCDLLVVDVAWELGVVTTSHGWLPALLHTPGPVVLTASATVPGLRRLQAALDLLHPTRPVVALGGPSGRSRPREVRAALGLLTRTGDLGERVVDIPVDARLRTCGVDSQPLPRSLLRAAEALLTLTSLTRKDPTS